MQWMEVQVLTTFEAVEAVAVIFERYGATGVIIQDSNDLQRAWKGGYGEIYGLNPADYPAAGVRVKAYLALETWRNGMQKQIEGEVKGLTATGLDPGQAIVNCHIVNEEDWADNWKKYYHPVHVTKRLVVKPSWEEYKPEDKEVVIEIDPGMAFGTGTHPTTVLCLQALERVVEPGDSVADVGCGTGVLAIASAKMGAQSVLALDLDPLAAQIARKNIEQNGVSGRVTVRVNHLLVGIGQKFDVIVTNILAEIVVKLVKDAPLMLKPGGVLIASGFTRENEEPVRREMMGNGFKIIEISNKDDWTAITASVEHT